MFDKLKHAITLAQVRSRIMEAAEMKHLFGTLYAIAGFVITAVVARWTAACPDLISSLGTIMLAGCGGFVAFMSKRPEKAPITKSILIGAAAAGLAACGVALDKVCGAGFTAQLWTLGTAGVWIGLGVYLRSPHKAA